MRKYIAPIAAMIGILALAEAWETDRRVENIEQEAWDEYECELLVEEYLATRPEGAHDGERPGAQQACLEARGYEYEEPRRFEPQWILAG